MNEFWIEDLEAGYYDKALNNGLRKKRGIQSNWHNTTFKKVSNQIKNEIHLDYACGPGSLVGIYTNATSICVDISTKQINYGKEKYGNRAKFYDLENFKFGDYKNYFETITLLGLLEFIDEDESINLINNLYSMLKPGGRIILTTVNFRSGITLLEKIQSLITNVKYSNQFVTKHNKDTLESLFKKTKFNDFEIQKYMNFGIFFSVFGHKISEHIQKTIGIIFFNYFGYLLFGTLSKQKE